MLYPANLLTNTEKYKNRKQEKKTTINTMKLNLGKHKTKSTATNQSKYYNKK